MSIRKFLLIAAISFMGITSSGTAHAICAPIAQPSYSPGPKQEADKRVDPIFKDLKRVVIYVGAGETDRPSLKKENIIKSATTAVRSRLSACASEVEVNKAFVIAKGLDDEALYSPDSFIVYMRLDVHDSEEDAKKPYANFIIMVSRSVSDSESEALKKNRLYEMAKVYVKTVPLSLGDAEISKEIEKAIFKKLTVF